jgi:hypothetical protein
MVIQYDLMMIWWWFDGDLMVTWRNFHWIYGDSTVIGSPMTLTQPHLGTLSYKLHHVVLLPPRKFRRSQWPGLPDSKGNKNGGWGFVPLNFGTDTMTQPTGIIRNSTPFIKMPTQIARLWIVPVNDLWERKELDMRPFHHVSIALI